MDGVTSPLVKTGALPLVGSMVVVFNMFCVIFDGLYVHWSLLDKFVDNVNEEQHWEEHGKCIWHLHVGGWSLFKSSRWCVAMVAHIKHVVAVAETGDGSDKGVDGNDSSETVSDVGGTGGWPSTTVNGYRDLAWIYALYAWLKASEKGQFWMAVKVIWFWERLPLCKDMSAYTNTVIVQKKWKSIP